MSLIINRTNYESYYLDFLEGNLSIENSNALLTFLDENPHLRIEEDLLNFSFQTEQFLDDNFVKSLKVFDKTETISVSNYENFMIASVEGVLSATKKIELKDFISKDSYFEQELTFYEKTKLIPDLEVVFTEKNNIKRGIIIPMVVRFVSIAAVLAIIFFAISTKNTKIYSKNSSLYLSSKNEAKSNLKSLNNSANNSKVTPISAGNLMIHNEKSSKIASNFNSEVINLIEKIEFKKIVEIENISSSKEIIPLDLAENNVLLKSKLSETEPSYLAFEEMKNPIAFVTSELNEKLNTSIDFRTAKATKRKQGGFYLKIGKFEISRKNSPQNELASN